MTSKSFSATSRRMDLNSAIRDLRFSTGVVSNPRPRTYLRNEEAGKTTISSSSKAFLKRGATYSIRLSHERSPNVPDDARIKTALNLFFEDYVKSFELRPCVKELLRKASVSFKLGLISNFTYAPVIYVGLRRLAINQFFNAVLVSADVGWRKPSERIFGEALRRLGVKAEETVYVGDSPLEDITGAKALGMRTVFVPSQFYSLEFLHENHVAPDIVVKDICELHHKFEQFLGHS